MEQKGTNHGRHDHHPEGETLGSQNKKDIAKHNEEIRKMQQEEADKLAKAPAEEHAKSRSTSGGDQTMDANDEVIARTPGAHYSKVEKVEDEDQVDLGGEGNAKSVGNPAAESAADADTVDEADHKHHKKGKAHQPHKG